MPEIAQAIGLTGDLYYSKLRYTMRHCPEIQRVGKVPNPKANGIGSPLATWTLRQTL
ncbi:MAG: hypothetical protein ACOH2M_21530 [Cypionkella sp.]